MNRRKTNKKKKAIKVLLGILVTILIIILAAGGTAVWYVNNKISKMNQVDIDEKTLGLSENNNL